MIDVDKWEEIFKSISRHKLRTFLTALGVFWGIFMLVLLLGAGNGLRNGIEFMFRDDAVNSIWLRRGETSMPFKGLPVGRRIQFSNEDYDHLKATFADIDQITGRFYLSGDKVVKYKDKALSYNVRSVHPGHKVLENTIIMSGRYLNDQDIVDRRKVAVIGKIIKENLFGDEDAIGAEINVGGIVYRVIGVFRDTGGEWEMRNIYIPITTAQQLYSKEDRIHQLMFTTDGLSVEEMNQLEEKIRVDFAARHQFDPKDRKAISVFNLAEEYQSFTSLFFMIKVFTWFVGIGSILAGVIGVSNIMLIVVKDRTKEIGIRKALGATPRSIVSMILQESIFITAVAGYLGMLASIALLYLAKDIESEFFRNPEINFGIAIIATLVLVITGALAGLMPALQAAKINPVTAMKSD